ncbi:hypothetical protein QQP08_018374 [Theobroma cacao]|nr:hypothetical protein QQP08_018374 [Theobroma cacao]
MATKRCSFHRSFGKASTKSAAAPHANRVESKAATMMMMTTASKACLIKAFLMQIIKPSSHDLQRRRNFQRKPTRFCPLNSSANGVAVS